MRWHKVVGLGLLLVGCGGISTGGSGGSQESSVGKGEGSEPEPEPQPPTAAGGSAGRGGGVSAVSGGSAPSMMTTGGGPSMAGGAPTQGGAEPAPGTCGSPKPYPPPASAVGCRGIKTGAFCAAQGVECSCLRCGLADLGHRSCFCDTTWQCSRCEFPATFEIPPDLPFCTDQADKLPCNVEGQMCQGAPGGEMCMCYADDEGVLIWDCDKPPIVTLW